MHIVAIAGSLRQGSMNRQLAEAARRTVYELDPAIQFTLLDWADVPMFNEDIERPAPPAVARVRKQILDADGIWFFTPEYNHFFPGPLKNLLDWLSRPVSAAQGQVLDGKPAAISGISAGGSGTAIAQDHLVALISFLNMDVMNKPRLTIPFGFSKMNDGVLDLGDSLPYLERQAQTFLEFVASR
ncbi:NADPH-dependent FMN reductase [Enorma massiliensis]|uniref:NADPH-dependent FMN reductase n=1 Tax=Enorma massiliensis TaxID=1472761 RepID=UPI003AF0F7BF